MSPAFAGGKAVKADIHAPAGGQPPYQVFPALFGILHVMQDAGAFNYIECLFNLVQIQNVAMHKFQIVCAIFAGFLFGVGQRSEA